MQDITITVNQKVSKYKNYFLKVAKEDKDKDLTSFLEKLGVDIKEHNMLFFTTINKVICVKATKYDEEKNKYSGFKATFKSF